MNVPAQRPAAASPAASPGATAMQAPREDTAASAAMAASAGLVESLARRLAARLLETPISWVLLAGPLVYKVKKPVRLPFVDYSTLERRRYFCAEEVRLNRRLAPSLYLGVSNITGPADAPEIDGHGPILDHVVRMKRFEESALFSEQLVAGRLTARAVDQLAERIATFHESAPIARYMRRDPASVCRRQVMGALAGTAPLYPPDVYTELQRWLEQACGSLLPLWRRRQARGRVRECHGDLHLANIVGIDDDVVAFDCIEFDRELRWIDVLDDAAFTLMDFDARGRPDLGWRFLNAWLEQVGDYDGLPALRVAVAYRALVRAHVEQLRCPGSAAAAMYARTASRWCRGVQPRLIITHGLPGSGKTFESQRLLEAIGAIRIRSDVERKRLFGLRPLQRSVDTGVDLYGKDATDHTYRTLLMLAKSALMAGLPVVLDAAFLKREERARALALAGELEVPVSILDCDAPVSLLHQRLQARRADASEADAAVLEKLRQSAEPLGPDERAYVGTCPATPLRSTSTDVAALDIYA